MISVIHEKVKEHLAATLTSLGLALPDHHLGEENIATQGAPPRITWVPVGGPSKAPRQVGADGNLGTRQIAQRSIRVIVHIWGEDFQRAEVLMNHFVAACREAMTSYSFRPIHEDWTAGQAGRSNLGRLIKLEIELDTPFTAEPLAISGPPNVVVIDTQVNH